MDNQEAIKWLREAEILDLASGNTKDREAVNMAISALQAQDSPKPIAESVQNVQNEDLISRKAAIDALHTWFRDGFDEDRWWNSTHVLAALESLPSAQPNLQPTCNRLATDCISRHAAIDAECEVCQIAPKKERGHNCIYYVHGCKEIECLRVLPSAQPETAKRIVGKSRDGMTLWYQCDMCNEPVDAQDDFCRGCGRRLTDG